MRNAVGEIYLQHFDRGPATSRATNKDRTTPPEMSRPSLASWAEERHYGPRVRIHAREVRPFVVVAIKARKGQILGDRGTAMFERDDVVDLKRQNVQRLGQVTVFASVKGTLPNQTLPRLIHVWSFLFAR